MNALFLNMLNLKKNNNQLSLLEMKKCIAAMKLSGSYKIAETFEEHLKKSRIKEISCIYGT